MQKNKNNRDRNAIEKSKKGVKLKFLLAALGSQGDIVPVLWAGQKLHARGHEVALMANPYFQKLVERLGFRFVPVGTKNDYIRYFRNPGVWQRGKSLDCTTKLMEETASIFRRAILHQGGDFDVLVNNPLAMCAAIIAEKYEKPSVTVHPDPFSFWFSACDMPVLSDNLAFLKKTPRQALTAGMKVARAIMIPQLISVNRFRKKLGLKPVKDFYDHAWTSATAHAGLFPDWFAKRQPDWPTPFETFDFPIIEGLGALDKRLASFLKKGDPPIVWTFGSANWHAKELSQIAISVSQFLRQRAVIVSKSANASTDKNILCVKSVPFDLLLKSSKAIVHHGGIGTIAYALQAQIPQLLVPMAFDQFDNADRMKKLGLAAVMCEKERAPEDYVRAVAKVIKDGSMQLQIKKYSKLMRASSSKDFASWMERWA